MTKGAYRISPPLCGYQEVSRQTGEFIGKIIPAYSERVVTALLMLEKAEATHIKDVNALAALILKVNRMEQAQAEEAGAE